MQLALAPAPGDVFDLAGACLDRGDMAGAVAAFRVGVERAPESPVALYNLATAQLQAGDTFEGAETLVRCLRLAPDFTDAHINLASALLRMGLLADARVFADLAVRTNPGSAEALLCLAGILHHSGEHEATVDVYHRALRLAPTHAAGLSSLGNALGVLGRHEEALRAHGQAVAAAAPDGEEHAECRVNRAMTLLAAGDLATGWAENEWRWRRAGHPPLSAAPPWAGARFDGQSILLHAEQGFGDTLQFVRYAPLVAERGGEVTLMVQPPLVRLLRMAFPGLARVMSVDETPPATDHHCPMMSLPLAFGTIAETIPADVPYIAADPAETARWARFLDQRETRGRDLRVGLVWAGSPRVNSWEARLIDRRRSLPATDLAALAGVPGVRFISLQKDAPPPDIAGLPMVDVMDRMADFADTAALVANCDLVISVDTAMAHLAGAMARPVWVLSRQDGCWRWMGHRPTTPWYPTMRLYHQSRGPGWTDVMADVRRDLLDWAARRPNATR